MPPDTKRQDAPDPNVTLGFQGKRVPVAPSMAARNFRALEPILEKLPPRKTVEPETVIAFTVLSASAVQVLIAADVPSSPAKFFHALPPTVLKEPPA